MTWDLEKAYETAVADERYHREMFQSRLSYHTNVVLVALGAVIAALVETEREWVFRLLGFALVVIGGFSFVTPKMIKRIYNHFIEHLDVRERLEVALGLRDPAAVADGASLQARIGVRPSIAQPSSPDFTSGFLFRESWIRSGRGRGYFDWMTWVFRVLGAVAMLGGVALLVSPAVVGVLPRPSVRTDPQPTPRPVIERSLGVIGPFEIGDTCVTTGLIERQVVGVVERAVASSAISIVVLGAADRMPVAEGSGRSFGNNTGIALARARCVAGWIAEQFARRDVSPTLDVRVRDAVVRTSSARTEGAAEDRSVEVLSVTR